MALFTLALAMRLYRLGEAGFWRDEATAAFWSQLPLGDLLTALRRDVHAPLYYVVLGGWSKLAGTGDWGMRLLNALLGAACAPLAVWSFLPLTGRIGAVLGGLMIAVMPGLVLWSQQLGAYPLLVLMAVLTIGAMLRLVIDRPRRPIAWATLLALSLAGMVYTHMWAVLVWLGLAIPVLCIALLDAARNRRLSAAPWPLLAAQIAAFLMWTPWLAAAVGQARSRTMDHLPPTPPVTGILLDTSNFWYNESITARGAAILLAVAALATILHYALRADSRRANAMTCLLGMVLIPHAVCVAVAPGRDIYYPRYALTCAPAAVALLVGGPILALALPTAFKRRSLIAQVQHGGPNSELNSPLTPGSRRAQTALAVAVTAFLVLCPWFARHGMAPGWGTFFAASYVPSPMREVAAELSKNAGPNDVIVLYPELFAPSLNWYFRGPQPQICYPATRRVELVDYASFPDRVENPAAPQQALDAALAALRGGGGRLWLIYNAARYRDRQSRIDYGRRFDEFADALARNFPGAATTDTRFWNPKLPYTLEQVQIMVVAPLAPAAAAAPDGPSTAAR